MYKELTNEDYQKLSPDDRITELRKWLNGELEYHRNQIRSIAGTDIEQDSDVDNVIATPFDELPTLISDYPEYSAACFLVKYRLEHNIEDGDISVLDTDEYGKLSCDLALDPDNEENYRQIKEERGHIKDLITLCRIFCFEDLQKNFEAWCPN